MAFTSFSADQVPVRSLNARVRNFRGKLLVACGASSVELDEVGAYIFKSIDGASSVGQIASRIASEYDISYEEALADGGEFIGELQALGIVGVGDSLGAES